jgi:hypothetical protein
VLSHELFAVTPPYSQKKRNDLALIEIKSAVLVKGSEEIVRLDKQIDSSGLKEICWEVIGICP